MARPTPLLVAICAAGAWSSTPRAGSSMPTEYRRMEASRQTASNRKGCTGHCDMSRRYCILHQARAPPDHRQRESWRLPRTLRQCLRTRGPGQSASRQRICQCVRVANSEPGPWISTLLNTSNFELHSMTALWHLHLIRKDRLPRLWRGHVANSSALAIVYSRTKGSLKNSERRRDPSEPCAWCLWLRASAHHRCPYIQRIRALGVESPW